MVNSPPTASWLAVALCAVWAAAVVPTLGVSVAGRDSWREADVLIVGRNFCREHTPLTEPRIDARGDGTGITGMELPLLNAAAGALSCAGLDEVVAARGLVALCSLLGALALFGLAKVLQPESALLALALFLSAPLVLYYGRAAMPDMPALALALCALWALRRGLDSASRLRVALSALLFALAGLVKLPVLSLGLLAAVWVFEQKRSRTPAAIAGWTFYAGAALVPPFLWLRHARALQDTYGLHYFNISRSPGQLLSEWAEWPVWRSAFLQHPFDSYVFPLVTVLALLAVTAFRHTLPRSTKVLGVAALACILLSGAVGAHHSYYGLPVVPFLCLAGAHGARRLAQDRRWVAPALVIASCAYGLFRVLPWFPTPDVTAAYAEARATLWKERPGRERIVLFAGGNPTLLWHVDRQGWVDPPLELVRTGELPAKVILVDHRPVDPPPVEEIEAALRARACRALVRNARVSLWSC